MQPEAYIEEHQEPHYQEYATEAPPEPKFLNHYTQDHFLPKAAIKEATVKKAIGLAAAAGGLFYLNKRFEMAEAGKAKELLIEKIKSAAVKPSDPASKTNQLLTWLVGIAGIGGVSHIGFEVAKLAQMSDHNRIIQNGLQP